MTKRDYLTDLLGKQEAAKLTSALKSGKTIIIKGEQKSGKSTLVKALNNAGYHAVEDFETYEVVLKKPLKSMIPNMIKTIS